ncbi:hypothetical protein F4778DRAFT_738963 [Xylariomycetidae sp. FL2044]|nr:hypothetical protein F4778DRAFT_738963 [Xylariomycetidae sp. FL2044]
MHGKTREKLEKPDRRRISDTLETLVLACSDQQVFTGAAYALTLRYFKGCTISAYHYNLVANMMLLTCATHLMSVTIVRDYWRYPWLAVARIMSVTGVFIVTGLLLTNQSAKGTLGFPNKIPPANETDNLLFLPAACFQSASSSASNAFRSATSSAGSFGETITQSMLDGAKIPGWSWYIIMLLFYGAAIIAEVTRFLRRGKKRPGWRLRTAAWFQRVFGRSAFLRKITQFVFLIYLVGGVGIGMATTITSGSFIFGLRRWVSNSGWLQLEDNGQNPENDATGFSQLVPIFSSALILWSLCTVISEKMTRRGNRKHAGEEKPPQLTNIPYLDPSRYEMFSPEEKAQATSYFSPNAVDTPGSGSRFDLASPSRFTPSRTNTNGTDLQAATPLMGGGGGGGGGGGDSNSVNGLGSPSLSATPATPQPARFSNIARPDGGTAYTPLPQHPESA